MNVRLALAGLALALVSGCASEGDYPSLAPRPIEQLGDAEPVRPTPVATPDAALDARLADIRADLAAAAKDFASASDRISGLVAAASDAGVGSTPWLDAEVALAELDGDRAHSTAALAALDRLAIARAAKLQPPYPTLETLHDTAEAQVREQSARIADLQARLPAPPTS